MEEWGPESMAVQPKTLGIVGGLLGLVGLVVVVSLAGSGGEPARQHALCEACSGDNTCQSRLCYHLPQDRGDICLENRLTHYSVHEACAACPDACGKAPLCAEAQSALDCASLSVMDTPHLNRYCAEAKESYSEFCLRCTSVKDCLVPSFHYPGMTAWESAQLDRFRGYYIEESIYKALQEGTLGPKLLCTGRRPMAMMMIGPLYHVFIASNRAPDFYARIYGFSQVNQNGLFTMTVGLPMSDDPRVISQNTKRTSLKEDPEDPKRVMIASQVYYRDEWGEWFEPLVAMMTEGCPNDPPARHLTHENWEEMEARRLFPEGTWVPGKGMKLPDDIPIISLEEYQKQQQAWEKHEEEKEKARQKALEDASR